MFKKLLEHEIINNNGQYFCHLCSCATSNSKDALYHIFEEKHQARRKDHMDHILQNNVKEAHERVMDHNIAVIALCNFICIPCARLFIDLAAVLQHIQGKTHTTKLENNNVKYDQNIINVIISNVTGKDTLQVRKKLNTTEVMWLLKQLRTHVEGDLNVCNKCKESIHSKILREVQIISNKDCKALIDNKVIVHEYYQFMCNVCNRCCIGPSSILQHINQKNHILVSNQTSNCTLDKLLGCNEVQWKKEGISMRSLSDANIQTENQNADDKSLYCEFCKCFLPSEDHVLPHIQGKRHAMSLKKQTEEQNKKENIVCPVVMKISQEKKELDSIEIITDKTAVSETAMIKVQDKSLKLEKCKICLSFLCQNDCLNIVEQKLLDNKIIIQQNNTFFCALCLCNIKSLHNILVHIQGKSHKNILKNVQSSISNLCNNTNGKANIVTLSSSSYTIDDTTNMLLKNTCKEDGENELVKSKNCNDFQNCSYLCELCKIQIDISNLFKHIGTVNHKCHIFSMGMGDDIILFKCFCCKSIIQGSSMLINHLSSTLHMSNLANVLTCPETSEYCNILNDLTDKSLPLCNIFIPKREQTSDVCFTEQCLISFETLGIKCSNNIKNNTVYYCLFCSAKLITDHNLIDHCKARMHLWRIKQGFLIEKQLNIDKTAALSKSLNNMTITDRELHELNKFDNDFALPIDVNAEIKKYLNDSPIKTKSRKQDKKKEKPLAERLNKMYTEKYLEIEEEMYTIHEQKIRAIQDNFGPIMPHGVQNFFCLACNEKVSKELYLLYEHLCIDQHTKNKMECIRKSTESEKLFKHYIQEISEDSVKCYPCGNNIHNDSKSIDIHINTAIHKKKLKMFVKVTDCAFNCILEVLNNLWYNIQRFSCVPCQQNFNQKLEFIEHISTKHDRPSTVRAFDFCIPCTTLWLSNTNSYTQHCSDIMHKYLVQNKDFEVEPLPDCMKEILSRPDEISDILFQQTNIVSNDNVQQEVRVCLENTLCSYFPSLKVFLFGSRTTGLGFADSDIDIYLDCGDTYYQTKSNSLMKSDLRLVSKVLEEHKDTWNVLELIEEARTPIIKMVHNETGIHCDISVTNGMSVEKSKLIRAFNHACLPCRKLILFIKKWLSHLNFPVKHGISSYALACIVIFYLQTESYLPSVATLIEENNSSRRICGWEVGVAEPKSNDKSVPSISTLLLGFFKFYADFDYRYNIICPHLGQPLAKCAFTNLHTLPEKMKPYIDHINVSTNPQYFRIDSALCVQDPFDLSCNLTKAVNIIALKYFKQYCKDSVSVLLSVSK